MDELMNELQNNDICALCNEVVRPKQHAISCGKCNRWQHRCHKGQQPTISYQEYLRSVHREIVSSVEEFICIKCETQTAHEIPHISENEDNTEKEEPNNQDDKTEEIITYTVGNIIIVSL